MKKNVFVVILAMLLMCAFPASGYSSSVVDTIGWITGAEWVNYEFDVDTAPQTYTATLSDLSWAEYYSGFSLLTLSISTSTREFVNLTIIDDNAGIHEQTGSVDFTVLEAPETFYASILGIGSGVLEQGKFGIEISPAVGPTMNPMVPVPATLLLLSSGLLALTALRRKRK